MNVEQTSKNGVAESETSFFLFKFKKRKTGGCDQISGTGTAKNRPRVVESNFLGESGPLPYGNLIC